MEFIGIFFELLVYKIINFGFDLRVFLVKVGLFFEEEMEIVFVGGFVEFLC